ncbi:MAG TPA: ribbon-helix-helix domain-containing protein [Alphaproteobacteria bacterium]|nr:ribbon-helix-helix domain-containing protein [Alphaproteobacteria bacterium]
MPAFAETNVIDAAERKNASSLVSRNITVKGHRTSMRLEPAMWDALIDICRREKLTIHQLCDIVAARKPEETSFTAAMRVFAMSYFRAASTEDGHSKAGHGSAFLFSAKKDFAGLMPHASIPAMHEMPQPQVVNLRRY